MDALEAMRMRRSIRRFTREAIPRNVLETIAESARLSPTGTNRQPLQFAVVSDPALCARIFPHIGWARRIPDGSAGPNEDTQPSAYIGLLVDRQIASNADTDAGAAAMSMLLAAQAQGVASCWLGSIARVEILSLLDISQERFGLHTLIALGYPAMRSRVVEITDNDTDYYLESDGALCVPKRRMEQITRWYE